MSGGEPAGPWWRSYFDRAFMELYRPLLPPEETAAEVEAVVEILGARRGARLLDVGCGWGRHAIPLAARGCRVTGVDRSAELLAEARRAAGEEGVTATWVRADVRELPFAPAFDAALSLFSSLGYFLSDAEDLRALRAVRAALRPGGALLLETMHRDEVAREYVEHDWWTGPDGEHVWVERDFDAVTGVSREWLRWRGEGGVGEKYHEIRVRSAPEWDRLLRAAGLVPAEWFGSWDLSEFSLRSERLVVLARAG